LITLTPVTTGKTVLSNVSLRLDSEDRIALAGRQWQWKAQVPSFIKLLAGVLSRCRGEVRNRESARSAIAAAQAEELDLSATPLLEMEKTPAERTRA